MNHVNFDEGEVIFVNRDFTRRWLQNDLEGCVKIQWLVPGMGSVPLWNVKKKEKTTLILVRKHGGETQIRFQHYKLWNIKQ